MALGVIYCTTKPIWFDIFKTNFMIVCILFGGALKCTLQIVMASGVIYCTTKPNGLVYHIPKNQKHDNMPYFYKNQKNHATIPYVKL